MAKNIRRMLAMVLVMCMFVSALPLQALAAEGDGTVIDGPNTETVDGMTVTTTTTTTQTTDDASGNTTVTVTIQQDTNGTTDTGATLERHETDTKTETTNANGDLIGSSGVNSGNEIITNEIPLPEGGVEVDVPLTSVDDPKTEEKDNVSTESFGDTYKEGVTGDLKNGEDDPEYNQTTTTVTPGKVTVTTTEAEATEKVNSKDTDLEYVRSEVTPDGTNDLVYKYAAPGEYQAGYEGPVVIPEMVEGYDYVYVGAGVTSKFVPARVFDKPMTKEEIEAENGDKAYIDAVVTRYNKVENIQAFVDRLDEKTRNSIAYNEDGSYKTDENGYIVDVNGDRIVKAEWTVVDPNGVTKYLHRIDNNNYPDKAVEGWFQDGKWEEELNGDAYLAVWDGPQQFVLVDGEGNIITTYCADHATGTEKGYGYNIVNLENATYYTKEEAEHIRTIALNGYWGAVGYKTDENGEVVYQKDDKGNQVLDEDGNPIPVPKEGSLEDMKQKLLESGEFTEEDLASLNDGVALTATQMAIWSYSNKLSGIQFVNTHYSKWGLTTTGDYDHKIPEDKEDEVKLMFRIYDYLTKKDGTKTENTMADTIVTTDVVTDMNLTVLGKADHENNNDDDDTNDAYVTDLSFALKVEPSGDKDESMKVTLIAGGKTIVGRICGTKESEDEVDLVLEDGNYWFRNIVLTEEDGQTITLNLEGVQNLQQGVYLYSSEVRGGTSSQTLVGMASGERGFDVTVNLSFELDVEGVVVTERVWRDEYDPSNPPVTPPTPPTNPPQRRTWNPPAVNRLANDDVVINEEAVPLATPAITGDSTGLWVAMFLTVAFAMVAVNLFDKKRQHEAF